MARFFAFFTLFHLSLTFFRPEVPFKPFQYLLALGAEIERDSRSSSLAIEASLTFLKKDCNSVLRLLKAGFILWSKQEAQRFRSTVSNFTSSSGAPPELQKFDDFEVSFLILKLSA